MKNRCQWKQVLQHLIGINTKKWIWNRGWKFHLVILHDLYLSVVKVVICIQVQVWRSYRPAKPNVHSTEIALISNILQVCLEIQVSHLSYDQSVCLVLPAIRIWNSKAKMGYQNTEHKTSFSPKVFKKRRNLLTKHFEIVYFWKPLLVLEFQNLMAGRTRQTVWSDVQLPNFTFIPFSSLFQKSCRYQKYT